MKIQDAMVRFQRYADSVQQAQEGVTAGMQVIAALQQANLELTRQLEAAKPKDKPAPPDIDPQPAE